MLSFVILAAADEPSQPPPVRKGGGFESFIFMAVLLIFIMWLLVFRPQAKRQREHQQILNALKPGDRVVTSGGIHGEIVSLKDNEIVLRIDPRKDVQVTTSRRAVLGLRSSREGDGEKQENK